CDPDGARKLVGRLLPGNQALEIAPSTRHHIPGLRYAESDRVDEIVIPKVAIFRLILGLDAEHTNPGGAERRRNVAPPGCRDELDGFPRPIDDEHELRVARRLHDPLHVLETIDFDAVDRDDEITLLKPGRRCGAICGDAVDGGEQDQPAVQVKY